MLYRVWNFPMWISYNQADAFVMLQAFANTEDLEFGNMILSVNDIVVSRIDEVFIFFVSLERFLDGISDFSVGWVEGLTDNLTVVYSNLNIYSSLKNGCWIHDPIEGRVS